MTCENIGANADGSEALIECHNYAAQGDKTVDMFDVYQGFMKSAKVDMFKRHIAKNYQAMKFEQYEKE